MTALDRTLGDLPRLVLAGEGLGWNGITAEQWQFPPLEPPERRAEAHEIALPLDAPGVLEWHTGRRWHRGVIAPGACCLTPAETTQRKRWPRPSEVLIVRLDPCLVERIALESGVRQPVELIERHGAEDAQVRHLGLALRAEAADGGASGRLYADALAAALAARLLAVHSAFPPVTDGAGGGLSQTELRRALAYLHDNLSQETSLAGLVDAVGTSPSRLTARFKRSTGLSPHQYVLQQRVALAQRLLRGGDLTPGQVAARVGFYDQSHLNRHFKRLVGATPRDFQRRT